MGTTTRIAVLLAAAFFSLASASTTKYQAQGTTVAGASSSDMYTAAFRVFSDHGFAFRLQDRESGVLATEWASENVAPGMDYRMSWRVAIIDGEARLNIDCEWPKPDDGITSHGGWAKCEKVPESWAKQAPEILESIRGEAARVAAKHAEH